MMQPSNRAMEDYLLQGPPAYKRPRLNESSLSSTNYLDGRANVVPFGFIAAQDREADMNMTAMSMGGNLGFNSVHEFGQLSSLDWRHSIPPDNRNRFVQKITQALLHNFRNGENSDNRSPKWIAAARKIENKAFKTASSRLQYFNLLKEEIRNIQMGYGLPVMSSQFLPSSSTTSSAAANNLQLVNMQQNYGPNSFVTASQSHTLSQPGIAHSATSVNLFSDDNVGTMRIPVTSSIGSARQQFDAFISRQPGSRFNHDQVPGNGMPIGDPSQFMSNADQVLAPNLLHSMNALMSTPALSQFMPSSAVVPQQRFILNDQSVLSENSSIINSQLPGRLQSKEWHKSVTFNVRNRLIRKMAQILSTTPDPQAGSLENRMHNCIAIATSVENETYRTANSMTQYYDLMVKRCHFITKERANPNQTGIQYYNLADIRRTYEALGISYPLGPSNNGSGNNSGNNGGGNNRDVPPGPPPPGVMPLMISSGGGGNNSGNNGGGQGGGGGGSGGGGGPLPYCSFARAQVGGAGLQQQQQQQQQPPPLPLGPGHNQLLATATSLNNQMNVNQVFVRRPHRGPGSNYPSTTTSGLLSNQSQNNGGNNGGGGGGGGRNERISPRSSMWHSNYGDGPSWRNNSGPDIHIPSMDSGSGVGRRSQPRFWLHNRNGSNRHDRRAPYNNPWATPEIIFVDNARSGSQQQRGGSLFGHMTSSRNVDRLQPYGTPWRSPDILFVENVRPAHRQAHDPDEPVIIPPEEDAAPTEHQQMMAIVKVVKTHGGRLEQKFRCSRRSCSASWPCIHRRLAASIQSHKTPIPG